MSRLMLKDEGPAGLAARQWAAASLAVHAPPATAGFVVALQELTGEVDLVLAADWSSRQEKPPPGTLSQLRRHAGSLARTGTFAKPYYWGSHAPRRAPFNAIHVIGGSALSEYRQGRESPRPGLVLARAMLDEVAVLMEQRRSAPQSRNAPPDTRELFAVQAGDEGRHRPDPRSERWHSEVRAMQTPLHRMVRLIEQCSRVRPAYAARLREEAQGIAHAVILQMRDDEAARPWRFSPAGKVFSTLGRDTSFLPTLIRFEGAGDFGNAAALLRPVGALAWQAAWNVRDPNTSRRRLEERARTVRDCVDLLVTVLNGIERSGAGTEGG